MLCRFIITCGTTANSQRLSHLIRSKLFGLTEDSAHDYLKEIHRDSSMMDPNSFKLYYNEESALTFKQQQKEKILTRQSVYLKVSTVTMGVLTLASAATSLIT